MLSGLIFDEEKRLIGAKALMTIWLVKQANSTVDSGGATIDKVRNKFSINFQEAILLKSLVLKIL